METLPPLPTFIENKMEVVNFVDFEILFNGQRYLVMFEIKLDVTFDPEANEVIIDCTHEKIDNF